MQKYKKRRKVEQKGEEQEKNGRDFPCGPVVENLPFNARDMCLTSDRETKIQRVVGQLSPCFATRETGKPQQRPNAVKIYINK